VDDAYLQACREGRPVAGHFVMDAHNHLGQGLDFEATDSGVDGLIRVMDRLGVDAAAVSSVEAYCGWTRGNDEIICAVRRYPKRIFGYLAVSAHDAESVLPECARCWTAGCRGLKLHTRFALPYDHPNLRPAVEFADDRGCPILCHTWAEENELVHLEPMFRRYTRATWILAHAGCFTRDEYVRLAAENENVYLETCISWCPKGMIEHFVKAGIADKVLWGSDAVFGNMPIQFGRVLCAEISGEDKKKLLCDNAGKVFGNWLETERVNK